MFTAAHHLDELTREDWARLAAPCRRCVFWESSPAAPLSGPTVKLDWLDATRAEWGRCGVVARVDDVPIGYAIYAPPAYLPRAGAFPTAPASEDCVLLAGVWVAAEHRGRGLGRALLTAVSSDAVVRGARAVEAFGRGGTDAGCPDPFGFSCTLPTGWLQAHGFAVIRDHPTQPRLRLDVRSLATWREDVASRLRVPRRASPSLS